jgi:6-phosphogluconate dehydrogenase
MSEHQIGMVGLGVMGRNLAFNIAEKGFSVAGYDAWPDAVDRLASAAAALGPGAAPVVGFKDARAFVASLRRPRRIVLLVKAGEVVDATLAALAPLLETGDMVVDGGNEHFRNTERRAAELSARGLRFFGMGISGGEEGARHGPSLMPGGDRAGYDDMAPILTRVAAQVDDGPCVTYCGPGGAGHYVKMIHNGIEYGDMQLIAEAYDLLRSLGGMGNDELAATFADWNRGELESYLIEITARIFAKRDPLAGPDGGGGGSYLIDAIADSASMKGTGRWAVQDASDIGAPVPTIAASVEARVMSADRAGRRAASKLLAGPTPSSPDGGAGDKARLVADVRAALYAAKACAYAQGMKQLQLASQARGWSLDLAEIARIWRGGCIIRAQFLGRIRDAYRRDAALDNLLFDPGFRDELASRQDSWRRVVGAAATAGVPVPAVSASLGYYDVIRRARLPANLIQAQRDLFGAHTFERLDRPGSFHVDW